MSKKKVGKGKINVSIRTITTWVSVGVFLLLSGIVAVTVWFVMSVLNETGQPPVITDQTGGGLVDSIDVTSLQSIENRMDEKTSRPLSDPSILRNPFQNVGTDIEPEPIEIIEDPGPDTEPPEELPEEL